MSPRRLRDAIDGADAERFVGRDAELTVVADLLDDETTSRILYLHGPGGIGKSTLLRAAAREAATRGFTVLAADGAELPGAADLALARLAAGGRRPFVVIDQVDALGAELPAIRDGLLDLLPDTARVAVASREAPDPTWRAGGLDAAFVDLPVGPLSAEAADELLAGLGVADIRRRAAIRAWALGSPLALTVAASQPEQPSASPEADLEARLVTWLGARSIGGVPREFLDVAALVTFLDARILAAALPSRPTRDAMRRLEALSVVQRVGARAMLHPVLAGAIRARLRATEPERYRALVGRIAEHLAARATLGEVEALLGLTDLVEDPLLRSGISMAPSATAYADAMRPGELVRFGAELGFDSGPDWPEVLERFERLADRVTVSRRPGGQPLIFALFASVRDFARGGPDGPVGRALIEAAGLEGGEPDRTILGVVMFAPVDDDALAEATRVGNIAAFRRSFTTDMRLGWTYYPEPDRRPRAILEASGQRERTVAGRRLGCIDYGPPGVIGFLRDLILGEQGFAPVGSGNRDLLADDDDPERKARLAALLDDVFGTSPDEQRLRRVIELAHLQPRRSEQEHLGELHVSRTTWFRLLQTARERVLTHRR